MEFIYARATTAAQALTWLGGAALLGCALLIACDVVSRRLFGLSMAGTDEITGYVFSIATAWAFSYCVLDRANIRIDAVYRLFGPAQRAVLDIIAAVLLLVFASVLFSGALRALSETIARGTISTTGLSVPLWIPQSLWVFGIGMLVASLVLQIAYSLLLALRRDWSGVARVAGIPSNETKIETEAGLTRQ